MGKEYLEKVIKYVDKLDHSVNGIVPAGSAMVAHEPGTYSDTDASVKNRIKGIEIALKCCPDKTKNYVHKLLNDEIDMNVVTEISRQQRLNQIAYNTCEEADREYFKTRLDAVKVDQFGNTVITGGEMGKYKDTMDRINFILDLTEYLSCSKKPSADISLLYPEYGQIGNVPRSEAYEEKYRKFGIRVPEEIIRETASGFHFPDKIEIEYDNLGNEFLSDAAFSKEAVDVGTARAGIDAMKKIFTLNEKDAEVQAERHAELFKKSYENSVWKTLGPAMTMSSHMALHGKLILINGEAVSDILERNYRKEHPRPKEENTPEMYQWNKNGPGDPDVFMKMTAEVITASLHNGIRVEVLPVLRDKEGEPYVDPRPVPIKGKNVKPKIPGELTCWKRVCHKVFGMYKAEYNANEMAKNYEKNKCKSIAQLAADNSYLFNLDFKDQRLARLKSLYRDDFSENAKYSIKNFPDKSPETLKSIVQCATEGFVKKAAMEKAAQEKQTAAGPVA